ncbi:Disease resistance protein RPP13 [Bienertia sinuspersici]
MNMTTEESESFTMPPEPVTVNKDESNSMKSLTIKTSTATCSSSFMTCTTALANKSSASPAYNSPSLISPPSSAFVSALQSPYASPRALNPSPNENEEKEQTLPQLQLPLPPSPPVSYCGSDIPSSSHTPPERSDDGRLKFVDSNPDAETTTSPPIQPRISFSFPVPRLSFATASVSSTTNAKLRSCDVFIGYHGQNTNLVRYCKWLKSELELQGIACFLADRARYVNTQSHEIADRIICSVSFGIVVISTDTLYNPCSMEEIRFFTQKKNFIPMFFNTEPMDIADILNCRSDDKHCRDAIEGLTIKLEAVDGDWRSCISKAAAVLRSKLGRQSIIAKELEIEAVELPFPRNKKFVGRQKELMEMESMLFGSEDSCLQLQLNQQQLPSLPPQMTKESTSEGFADKETEMDKSSIAGKGRYISLELELTRTKSHATTDSQFESVKSRSSLKTHKYKNSRSGKDKSTESSVICISGPPGVGKTELALEFASKYSNRYKMVLWVGGEARYLRQNILNLSINLGSDVSADLEKERGGIRNFEEQENEAFKRIKRELFRDMPYLIIIDHLETENEWWEGKDLKDLIPRTTGGTHVIITTRLSKVMNFNVMQLGALPLPDAMMLIRGRQKYPVEELECLKKFEEKLGSSTFGLAIVDSLLTELAISPSALFKVVQQASLQDVSSSHFSSTSDKQICRNNPFLIKILVFCYAILDKATHKKNGLASRMLLVGAWFAPSPISANLLATAAKHIPAIEGRLKKWSKCLNPAIFCCSGCPLSKTWKSEEEYALLLVRLGLARRILCKRGLWIQFHPITRMFARTREQPAVTQAAVVSTMKIGKPLLNSDHLWASAFLVFGFKSEPPLVQLKAMDMVLFIKKTAIPLAIGTFTTFSRCNSALELLKISTGVLEDVEKSFISQIQDWRHGSLCWNKNLHQSNQKVDEYAWEEVTLLKATLLETRAKLLLRGGYFDSAEELCRTCISIRTVMLGHSHAQTLAAQETLAKLVRLRSKM